MFEQDSEKQVAMLLILDENHDSDIDTCSRALKRLVLCFSLDLNYILVTQGSRNSSHQISGPLQDIKILCT